MSTRLPAMLLLGSITSVTTMPIAAFAADAGASDSTQLEEIIVTAARRSQDLQKVSTSVQVVDGEKLQNEALSNVAQILQDLPSVQVTGQPGGFSIDIRGQGADLPSGAAQGAVALVFDGVYNIQSLGTTVGFFDVNNIEILSGPQSTRYGPNADGGVVKVTSKDPTLGGTSGSASLTAGNYGLFRTEVAQDIPVGDRFAMRFSAATINRDSFMKPQGANNIGQSLRVKALYEVTDNLNLKLQYQIDHVGGTGSGAEPWGISKVAPYSGDSINNARDPWALGDYNSTGTDGPASNRVNLAQQTTIGSLGYRINDLMTLDVTSSYITISGDEHNCHIQMSPPWNIGGSFSCYGNHEFAPFYQAATEVRLHNTLDTGIQWNVGYYHWNYKKASWSEENGGTASSASMNGTTTNSLFGEVTLPLSNSFRAIVGARESFDTSRIIPGNGNSNTYSNKLSHTDYRVGEEWDITPNSMQYFTVSTGYRPGGLRYVGTLGYAVKLKSEVNTSFELGFKNKFLDNRLQVNVAAYMYKLKDYINLDNYNGFDVTLVNPYNGNPAGATWTCGNGPQPAECAVPPFNNNATVKGLDAQVRFAATPSDMLGLNASLISAKFDKNQGTCAVVHAPTTPGCWDGYNSQTDNSLQFFNLAGATMAHAPTLTLGLNHKHTFFLDSGANVFFGWDIYHSNGYYVHPVEDSAGLAWQPSYTTGNVNVGYRSANGNTSVTAYMRNVTNYAVKQSSLPFTSLSDPRNFGVTLNVKW